MTENKLAVLDRISSQMRAVLDHSDPDAYDTNATLPQLREAYTAERRFWNEGGPVMARTIDTAVPAPGGQVAIRLHVPTGAAGAAICYIHGGGYVLGNLDTHDRIQRILADETGATVVAVDYSLSPEAKFPTAIQQCAAVAEWITAGGGEYGLDGRLAFAGDSGGAQLCLATYLYLRDHSEIAPKVRALALYYGLFGLRDSVSRRMLGGPWDGLTEADLDYYTEAYLADTADARSPYFDCLSADLSDVPPSYIAAAELDPLRDDSAALAMMLANHGVDHEHELFPGVLHAFLHNSRLLDAAWDALRHGAAFLNRHLTDN
ncbi:MAG: acetyl esterase [Propionibacteriaceae bacterium]|jgi:acetyl esterase|nr:acetyl esterase [Propionibacteriaceae bacterium]